MHLDFQITHFQILPGNANIERVFEAVKIEYGDWGLFTDVEKLKGKITITEIIEDTITKYAFLKENGKKNLVKQYQTLIKY